MWLGEMKEAMQRIQRFGSQGKTNILVGNDEKHIKPYFYPVIPGNFDRVHKRWRQWTRFNGGQDFRV